MRTRSAAVLAALPLALALVALVTLTVLPTARADEGPSATAGPTTATDPAPTRPPVETETPGGATCLPGGPTTGCAPDQTDRPRHRRSATADPTRSTGPRTEPARPRPAPERSRTPRPRSPAPAASPAVVPATGPTASAPPKAEASPQASKVAAQSTLPDPAPGWVGPVATALLVLLAGVLLTGPVRRRWAGRSTSSGPGPGAT